MLDSLSSYLIELLFTLPCVLIALTVHEVSHGWMAFKLGDPTARNAGRLTLNPLKHIDPLGTLCMIFFHFGWAKPVPINSRYFRKPRRDTALTAAAGPISNFIMALIGALLYQILQAVFIAFPAQSSFTFYLQFAAGGLVWYFHLLNLTLGLFNLIPVPPLDGSRIFLTFLPAKYYFGIMQYERYIQLGLLLLLWTNVLDKPLSILVDLVSDGMFWLVSLLPII